VSAVRRCATATVLGIAVLGGVLIGATPASAHPLGNATVNHYHGLHLYPDRVVDKAVVDAAEIPTLQRKSRIDGGGDGVVDAADSTAYAASQCEGMAASTELVVDGARAQFAVISAAYAERPGAIRLVSGRLTCELEAKVDLTDNADVAFASRWDGAGIGWHEITAQATGLTLQGSPFPATSISNELTNYPNDLLSAPLDVREGRLATEPGSGSSTYAAAAALPLAGPIAPLLQKVTNVFDEQVGAENLTVWVALLAMFLAVVLGAGHALLPGHGKTIMAAYLVGRRGRMRDVVAVGATVTLTHTASVLVLGVVLSLGSTLAPTSATQTLAVVSGLIVTVVGLGLVVNAVRRRSANALAMESAARELALVSAGGDVPVAPHAHGYSHGHSHGFGQSHDHGPSHQHGHDHPHKDDSAMRRSWLVGLGVAGGLVPSPSALLVLLAAVALGRGAFGVLLVLAYGVGMAATLTTAGLLFVRLRDRLVSSRIGARASQLGTLTALLPFVTASLVLVVGLVLTLRALGGGL